MKKRPYMRCRIACSIPPMYWSTGMKCFAASGSNGLSSFQGSQNRRKYQDESTNVSIVSVSRSAGPSHKGQVVWRKVGCRAKGDSPVGRNSTSSGARIGRRSGRSPTAPWVGQYTTGMGHPQ